MQRSDSMAASAVSSSRRRIASPLYNARVADWPAVADGDIAIAAGLYTVSRTATESANQVVPMQTAIKSRLRDDDFDAALNDIAYARFAEAT